MTHWAVIVTKQEADTRRTQWAEEKRRVKRHVREIRRLRAERYGDEGMTCQEMQELQRIMLAGLKPKPMRVMD